MKGERLHPVIYDHKRGLWTCRDEGCDFQMLPAKMDEMFKRSVSLDSGHTMWVEK